MNPYESPIIPSEAPTSSAEPAKKKRPTDFQLFLSAFSPLLWFLGTLFVLGVIIIVADWIGLWMVRRNH